MDLDLEGFLNCLWKFYPMLYEVHMLKIYCVEALPARRVGFKSDIILELENIIIYERL